MKILTTVLVLLTAALSASSVRAIVLTSIPSPTEQDDGMIMPMVMLNGQTLGSMFMLPMELPKLQSLDTWSPGDTFSPTAPWFSALDPVGGKGNLFNSQFGFMFGFVGGTPNPPPPINVGIRLKSFDPGLQFWNDGGGQFDEAFPTVGSQVLWDRGMWHPLVTIPKGTEAKSYSASFEFFITDAPFTGGTGKVDYSPTARGAIENSSYHPVTLNLRWDVVPEPATAGLVGFGLAGLVLLSRRNRNPVAL